MGVKKRIIHSTKRNSNMPAVSVIMPLYNSARFLPRAVESVLNQSFGDFELILVNDGSTDASPEICGKYASLDNRVIVLHQPNAGMSAARNRGLETAEGEYVAFIDSDDEYVEGLLEENYSLAVESGADVVKYGITRCSLDVANKSMTAQKLPKPAGGYDKNQIIEKYPELRKSRVFTFIWDSLFKKSLILENNIRFDSRVKVYGDFCFNYDCLPHIRKLAVNPGIYYLYFVRKGYSASTKYDPSKNESRVIMSAKEHKFFAGCGLETFHPGYRDKLSARYLSAIIMGTFAERSPGDYAGKRAFLESVREQEQFGFLDKNRFLSILRGTGKYGLLTALFKLRSYRLLMLATESRRSRELLFKVTRVFSCGPEPDWDF